MPIRILIQLSILMPIRIRARPLSYTLVGKSEVVGLLRTAMPASSEVTSSVADPDPDPSITKQK